MGWVCPECGERSDDAGTCAADGAARAPQSDALLGELVGTYRVCALLGIGGMGRVYRAVHPRIGARVALKVLSAADDPTATERFFDEARAVNLIRHPRIVTIQDLALLPDGRPYIEMELLEGVPLAALIRERGALPVGSVLRVFADVLDAIAAAHDKGIVHRDLKPENVFVARDGRAKVLDFGVARMAPAPDGAAGRPRTVSGAIVGTPSYLAPEQARALPADARSDVYALGVVLFEALTGQRPFRAESLFELLKQQVESPPPAPRDLRPQLPAALEAAILRALAKAPEQRFASARAMAGALAAIERELPPAAFAPLDVEGVERALAARPPADDAAAGAGRLGATVPLRARPSGSPRVVAPAARPPRRRPLWIAAALLGGLLVAGLAWLRWGGGRRVPRGGAANLPDAAPLAVVIDAALSPPAAADASDPSDEGFTYYEGVVPTEPGGPHQVIIEGPPADVRRFAVRPFAESALALARRLAPDAELTDIIAMPVAVDGTSNLLLADATMEYVFRSAILAARAGEPRHCAVTVMVKASAVMAWLDNRHCWVKPVRLPRCSPALLWARAISMGADKRRRAWAAYALFDDEQPIWELKLSGVELSYRMVDTCK